MKSDTFLHGHAYVEVMPGSHIDNAAHDAVALAKVIGGPVNFSFNGILLAAKPDTNPKELSARFHYAQQYEALVRKAVTGEPC